MQIIPSHLVSRLNRIGFLLLLTTFTVLNTQAAPDGKALFQTNCASCHNPYKDATGPKLNAVDSRVPSKEWLYNWVRNSASVIKSGDKYANEIFNKWSKTAMTGFPNLKNEEIDAIIAFVNQPPPTVTSEKGNGSSKENAVEEKDKSLLYIIITAVLLLAAIILGKVNSVLQKTANDKEGLPTKASIPFYRNKLWIALFSIIAFIGIGVYLSKGGVGMGRQQNYMPKQPIFYSHKVHAGINQINCLYCHTGAEKGRHALIPSPNVCMNCHKQINEYTSAESHKLVTLEGKEINGTKEIKELYKYAGWNPEKKEYIRNAKGEIATTAPDWVKVHNLPDHVYFNHSLHTVSGKIACQRCHGPVQEMDEVYQFSQLSMGWCVNCHRETNVQFADNNYYSIFQKYHEEIKNGTRTDVKVSDIGGLECQKCHY